MNNLFYNKYINQRGAFFSDLSVVEVCTFPSALVLQCYWQTHSIVVEGT